MEQHSPEWFAARLGKATASRISDILARTKSGWGASRKNYAAELVCERMTGGQADRFTNAAMQWGTDTEPQARAAYEFLTGAEVEEVGFIQHPTIKMSGASPDGLIGSEGGLEIKCPNSSTHIETLLGAKIPDKYEMQMLWGMACTGRVWWDFVSFDPRLPAEMQIFVKRLHRDDARIKEVEADVRLFLKEVDDTVSRLREMYAGGKPAPAFSDPALATAYAAGAP